MDRAQNRKALCPIHFAAAKGLGHAAWGHAAQVQGKEKKAAQAQSKTEQTEMPAKKQKEARAPSDKGARADL